jgi:PTS system mannose-specific IIC component
MVSRPIVIATAVAWIMGNPLAGLMVGAILELFYLNKLPLGTCAPPNDSLVAILAAITAAALIREGGYPDAQRAIIAFSLLIYMPAGWLALKTEYFDKNFHERLSDKLLAELDPPEKQFSPIRVFPSLARYFFYSLAMITMGLLAGLLLIPFLFSLLPPFGHTALSFIYYLFPLIGGAAAITTTQNKRAVLYFSGLFILAVLFSKMGALL